MTMKKSIQLIILLFAISLSSFAQKYEYHAAVKYNGKWGIIDKTGKWKVEPTMDFDRVSRRFGFYIVKKNDKYGVIDKTGKIVIPLQYDQIHRLAPSSICVFKVKKNRKFGLIDKTGKIIVPIKYGDISRFSEGLCGVRNNRYDWGFIDKTGKIIIPFFDNFAVYPFSEGLSAVSVVDDDDDENLSEKYGFIDKTGKIVIPLQYDEAYPFSEGLSSVKKNDKYGFIDRKGEIVIPFQYDIGGVFIDGFSVLRKNNKWGVIDKIGENIIPFQYDYVYNPENGFFEVEKNNKSGVISKTGKIIIPLQYDIVGSFLEGLAIVKKNDKYGFIDRTGKTVIPFQYDKAYGFSEGLANVKKNDRWSFIDKTGRIIIPLQYDEVSSFSEGLCRVKKNGKIGFIDKTGKIVIPLQFDVITPFSKTKVIADNIPPQITITYPNVERGFKVVEQNKKITIQGIVKSSSGIIEVLVNGQEAHVDAKCNFTKTVLLAFGENTFTIIATDVKQNTSTKEFTIKRTSQQQQTIVVNKKTNKTGFETKKYYALIIGVQNYRDPSINDLDKPILDAQKLYNELLNNYTFDNQNVKFLKNPTKDEITDALDYYSDILTENNNLLIFYAGHGYWDKKFKQGYWLASDANRSKRGTWLSNSTIRDYMQGISAKHSLLITDACFGGGIFKSRDAFANPLIAINQLNKLYSRKAMTSGALSEVPDRSVFIEYLVRRLRQNTERYLSSEQLFASFKIAVINNSSNGQVPQFGEVKQTGDEGGDFIFIRKY